MKTDFKPGRYGMAFKNGKLYSFAPNYALVMSPWPDPRAWLKRASHGWKCTRKWPDETLSPSLFPKGEVYEPAAPPPELGPTPEWAEEVTRRQHALHGAYFDLIPDPVRTDLLRYDKRKWHLLNLMARCPGAEDLSQSNPALAYSLASNWVFHKPGVTHPMRSARSLVNRKQKRILEWLGFPATEPVRRILAKIVPQSLSVISLLYLRDALVDLWVLGTLSHLERINASALRLAADPLLREHVTPRLIEELSAFKEEDSPQSPAMTLLRDTLRMARAVDWQGAPRQFVSLYRMRSIHDDLAARLGPSASSALPSKFPPPPFPGTVAIRPVLTPNDLYAEGQTMHHCVGIRADSVVAGHLYVYQVLDPVRATLAIARGSSGWVYSEMQGVCNEKIPVEIQHQVVRQLLAKPRVDVQESEDQLPLWKATEEDAEPLCEMEME